MKYDSKDQLLGETHRDLISIANTEYNLGVSTKFTKEQIASLIMNAQRSGKVTGDAVEVLRGERQKAPEREELPPGYCILRLQKSRFNPNGYPVVIGLQGKISLLPIGVNFKCKEWVIEHLSNALSQEIKKDPEQGSEESVWVHSYPFTVVKHNPSDNWNTIEDNIRRNLETLGEVYVA